MITVLCDDQTRRLDAYHLLRLLFDENQDVTLSFSLDTVGDDASCRGMILWDGKEIPVAATASVSRHRSEKRALNAALGRAVLTALDRALPYGYSVGVRPVKVALAYIKDGMSADETEAFLVSDYGMAQRNASILCALAARELALAKTVIDNDICLYLSVPFCPTRCAYCSFISSSAPKHLKMLPSYTDLLCEEIEILGEAIEKSGRRVRAVYMGGGTPSVLSAVQLNRIFQTLGQFPFMKHTEEITVECGRPDTVDDEKLTVLKNRGVERICINPQTTNDAVLRTIGRTHTTDDFYRAFSIAKKVGFHTLNCDLIAGLPDDNTESFQKSVDDVLSLKPENLTVHTFSAKKSAAMTTEKIKSNTSATLDWVEYARLSCIKRNLSPYYLYRQKNTQSSLENIGYALPGHECLYNQLMMEDMCSIISLGAGGISKLFRYDNGLLKIVRVAADKYPFEYFSDEEKRRRNQNTLCEYLLR